MHVSNHRNRLVTSRGDTARRSRGEPTEAELRREAELAGLRAMMEAAPGADSNNYLTDTLDRLRGEQI